MLKRIVLALSGVSGWALGVALGLALGVAPLWAQTAEPAGRAQLTLPGQRGFGGFSSIDFAPDGTFYASSDRGSILHGRLLRTGAALTGAEVLTFAPLRDQKGAPLPRYYTDAEGIAVDGAGGVYVSFEGRHRVTAYPDPFGASAPFDQPAAFADLQLNSSLEALAIDDEGSLYTLPERSGELTRPFPVWRYRNGTWDQPFSLRRDGDFLAVGADFGPDGKLYLLERFNVLITFASRVRRFTIQDGQVTNEETVLETSLGTHGDLEGIAVSQDGAKIRLTLIADDNFKPFLANEIVEYVLSD